MKNKNPQNIFLKFLKNKQNRLEKKNLKEPKRKLLKAVLLIIGLILVNAIVPIGNFAYIVIASIVYAYKNFLPYAQIWELEKIKNKIKEIENNSKKAKDDSDKDKSKENDINKQVNDEVQKSSAKNNTVKQSTVEKTDVEGEKQVKPTSTIKNLNINNNPEDFNKSFEIKKDVSGKVIVNGAYRFKKNTIIQDSVSLNEMKQFRLRQEQDKQKVLKK